MVAGCPYQRLLRCPNQLYTSARILLPPLEPRPNQSVDDRPDPPVCADDGPSGLSVSEGVTDNHPSEDAHASQGDSCEAELTFVPVGAERVRSVNNRTDNVTRTLRVSHLTLAHIIEPPGTGLERP